jgi:hypothetical protein
MEKILVLIVLCAFGLPLIFHFLPEHKPTTPYPVGTKVQAGKDIENKGVITEQLPTKPGQEFVYKVNIERKGVMKDFTVQVEHSLLVVIEEKEKTTA